MKRECILPFLLFVENIMEQRRINISESVILQPPRFTQSKGKIDISKFLSLLDDDSLSGICTELSVETGEFPNYGTGGCATSWRLGGPNYKYHITGPAFAASVAYTENSSGSRPVQSLSITSQKDKNIKITVEKEQLRSDQIMLLLSKCETITARTIARTIRKEQEAFDNVIASLL